MKKIIFTITLLFFALSIFSQSLRKDIENELKNNPENIVKRIEVMHNGSNLCSNYTGLPRVRRKDSKKYEFVISSITKQFTAAAIYILIKEGKLNLNQKISEFFPDYSVIGNSVSINHLLNHSAGIVNYEDLIPKEFDKKELSNIDVLNLVKFINKTYFEPGTQFKYNNTSYCILALIVEKVSGLTFENFIKHKIFKPLRMRAGYKNEGLFNNEKGLQNLRGDWGINLSLNDYEIWSENRDVLLNLDYQKMFNVSNIKVDDHSYFSFGNFIVAKKPFSVIHSGRSKLYSCISIEIPSTGTSIFYYTSLEDSSSSFLPIELILKKYKILPESLDSKVYHESAY